MTRASGTTEVFSRAVIDAQLQDVGWNPKDGQSVRYEYPLPDSTRADYVLYESYGRTTGAIFAKSNEIGLTACH